MKNLTLLLVVKRIPDSPHPDIPHTPDPDVPDIPRF